MNILIKFIILAIFGLYLAQPSFAACFNATSLGAIGNTSISSTCTIAANTSEVADGTTSQDSTNTADVTLTAAVTVNSGTTGTTVLGADTFVISTGGSIAIGASNVTIKPDYPVWLADGDADGWVSAWTFYTATASGRWRLGLLKSVSDLDCNDAAFSETNTCYAAFYPAFYPSFAPYGGFSPYGSFYPVFSP